MGGSEDEGLKNEQVELKVRFRLQNMIPTGIRYIGNDMKWYWIRVHLGCSHNKLNNQMDEISEVRGYK